MLTLRARASEEKRAHPPPLALHPNLVTVVLRSVSSTQHTNTNTTHTGSKLCATWLPGLAGCLRSELTASRLRLLIACAPSLQPRGRPSEEKPWGGQERPGVSKEGTIGQGWLAMAKRAMESTFKCLGVDCLDAFVEQLKCSWQSHVSEQRLLLFLSLVCVLPVAHCLAQSWPAQFAVLLPPGLSPQMLQILPVNLRLCT